MNTRDLLTLDEIVQVQTEAQRLRDEGKRRLYLRSGKTGIYQLSSKSDLILVHGNEATGFEHIVLRHSLVSNEPFWKDGKRGHPSKFPLGDTFQFLEVAEAIYKPENRAVEELDTFDVYVGYAPLTNTLQLKFKLLCYKGTGIIHTLYPSENKNPFNKKRILNLKQGRVSAKVDLISGAVTFTMPYLDIQDTIIANFVVIYEPQLRKEKWYVVDASSPTNRRHIQDVNVIVEVPIPIRIGQLDFMDMAVVEKHIKNIIPRKFHYHKR